MRTLPGPAQPHLQVCAFGSQAVQLFRVLLNLSQGSGERSVFPDDIPFPGSLQGMGYLHAKGILHKDLKSKNVFYDNGKVVITDFGLFSISGVLQAGR